MRAIASPTRVFSSCSLSGRSGVSSCSDAEPARKRAAPAGLEGGRGPCVVSHGFLDAFVTTDGSLDDLYEVSAEPFRASELSKRSPPILHSAQMRRAPHYGAVLKIVSMEEACAHVACARASADDGGVCKVYDLFADPVLNGVAHRGKYALCIELMDGGDMMDFAMSGKRLVSEDDTLRFIKQACLGLATVHGAGLVHRDIKPENFFVSRSGAVQLGDFGFAEPCGSMKLGKVGSLHFVAPEVVTGEHAVCPGSDMWSLGAAVFVLVTGGFSHALTGNSIKYMLPEDRARLKMLPQFAPRKWSNKPQAAAIVAAIMQTHPGSRMSATQVLALDCMRGL